MDQDHVHTKLLYAFTKDRSIGIPENCIIDLGNTMSENVLKVIVKEASIPNTMYNVTPFNNTIVVQGITYTIPKGHYDITTLITTLQNTLAIYGLVITNNLMTYKLTFTTTGPVTYSSQSNGSTIGRVIGLDRLVDLTTASAQLPYIYDLSGPSMLFLYSNELCGKNSNMATTNGNKPALVNFIVNAPFGEFITFIIRENETDSIDFDSYYNLRTFGMKLVNEYGEQVDLNGGEYMVIFKIFISTHR